MARNGLGRETDHWLVVDTVDGYYPLGSLMFVKTRNPETIA